jgi:hypothetical protein
MRALKMKIEYKGMGMTEEAAKAVLGSETFDVRLYDRHEGYWIDIKLGATWAEAQRSMEEGTKGGTRYTEYAKGDYYAVFPGGARMLFDGRSI